MIYLYVKKHEKTGLKYFGKTAKYDPYEYSGSGVYWKHHLDHHGTNVETLNVWSFDTEEKASEFALKFSKENNIVESSEWANLRPENGKDGAIPGSKLSHEHKRKISEALKGVSKTKSHVQKVSKALKGKAPTKGMTGRKHSKETRKKISEANKRRFQNQT